MRTEPAGQPSGGFGGGGDGGIGDGGGKMGGSFGHGDSGGRLATLQVLSTIVIKSIVGPHRCGVRIDDGFHSWAPAGPPRFEPAAPAVAVYASVSGLFSRTIKPHRKFIKSSKLPILDFIKAICVA